MRHATQVIAVVFLCSSSRTADRDFSIPLRVPGFPRQKPLGNEDGLVARPFGQIGHSISHAVANLPMGRLGTRRVEWLSANLPSWGPTKILAEK